MKHIETIIRRSAAVVLVAVVAMALGTQAYAQKSFTIPFSGPMSGPIALFGVASVHGVLAAVEDINKAGGLKSGPWKGYQLKIKTYDDNGNPQESANIAQKLSLDKNVKAIIGHIFSGNCLSALPIYDQNEVSMVTPICTNPTITELGYKSAIRVVPDDGIMGIAITEVAVNELGGKKIGILYANHDYGRGLFDSAAAHLKKLGISMIAEPYNEGDTDYNSAISRLKNANIDMLLHFGFYVEAALQRRQARQQGLNVPFVTGPGPIGPQFLELGGKDVEDTIMMDYVRGEPDSPKVAELHKRVKEKYDEGWTVYHRNGYDALIFLAKALESSSDDSRKAVNAALLKTKIPGLSYPLELTSKGNLMVPMDKLREYLFLKIVKNGKLVPYQ